jgi:hypothetical protein
MQKLFKRIQDLLTRDIREMIFRREEPRTTPVTLTQVVEPTTVVAAEPLRVAEQPSEITVASPAAPARKPRARRAKNTAKKPKA